MKESTEALNTMESMLWVRQSPNYTKAWNDCERGDWMLWLLQIDGADKAELYDAALEAIEPYFKYLPVYSLPKGQMKLTRINRAAMEAVTLLYTAPWAAVECMAMAHETASYNYSYYDSNAKKTVLKECAEIVKKRFPKSPAM